MKNWKRILTVAAIVAIFGFAACGGGGDEEFTVTFNLEGGNIDGNTASVGITVNSGEKIDNLPDPKKTDCTFGGWFTEKNGNGNAFNENTPVTANITVYAKWLVKQSKTLSGVTAMFGSVDVIINYTALPDTEPDYMTDLVKAVTDICPGIHTQSGILIINVTATAADGGFEPGGSKTLNVRESWISGATYEDMLVSLLGRMDDWMAMDKSFANNGTYLTKAVYDSTWDTLS
jgi:uncharacterized repeat protein (TIGR02543 family)